MHSTITTIFTDIGGVLLTNGWDHLARKQAAEKFKLDYAAIDERHKATFDTYESGEMTLDEYLDYLVFYQPCSFTKNDFIAFMHQCSQPYNNMIELVKGLKEKYTVRVVAVSNEGLELNRYRIDTFKLNHFIDFFVSSSFVHMRKPDTRIFRLALDLAQTPLENIIYIEDRSLFVQAAAKAGITGIVHNNYEGTKMTLEQYGLQL
ncbi:MAG: HAD hydrolase-like protein [Ferruginibacter sp.]